MTKLNYILLFMLSFATHTHLDAAQMNVEVKEQEEKIELTAQEQTAADKMFDIVQYETISDAQLNELRALLQRYPRIVDAQNNDGWISDLGTTPLMYAANNVNAEVVKLLIAADAQIDAQNNDGATPLMIAARNGHAETVKLLIAAGAQIDAQNNDGWTPLMIATRNGHAEIVQLLIYAGAQLDVKNSDGDTASDIAISYNHEKRYDNAVTAGLAEKEKERYEQAQQVAKKELEQHMIPDLAKITAEYAYNPQVPEDLPKSPEPKKLSWWDKAKKLASKLSRGKQ